MMKSILMITTVGMIILSLGLVSTTITANAQMNQMTNLKTVSDTIESVVDPGIGHEMHQLAIILPPSDNVYSGTLSYDASEPIQLVTLHGPLDEGKDVGQPIWTTDGETKFALTFVDHEMEKGTWEFSGNALAVHTKNTNPFTTKYTVNYVESEPTETIMSSTMESVQDPGLGHESHQLMVILPPSEDVFSGVISYSASEPIQLVSLMGPLTADDDMSQPIWTPDVDTNFGLTLVDPENSMGSWMFSGNALALHTMNTEPFTASFSVHGTKMQGGMEMQGQMQAKMQAQDGMKMEGDMGMKKMMPPHKQMKSGIDAKDVTCKEGLDLLIKLSNGKPICVKPTSGSILMERGWAMMP